MEAIKSEALSADGATETNPKIPLGWGKALIWVCALAPALTTIFSPRVRAWTIVPDVHESLLSATRVGKYLIPFALILAAIISFLIILQFALVPRRSFRPILWLLSLYGVLALALLRHGAFHERRLIVPLVLFAIYVSGGIPVRTIRNVVRVYILGSLIALIMVPDWAFGTDNRLLGITSSALELGALSVLSLALERAKPFSILAAICLVVAQSRTAWVAGLCLLLIVLLRQGTWAKFPAVAVAMVAAFLLWGQVQILGENSNLSGRLPLWNQVLREVGTTSVLGSEIDLFSLEVREARFSWAGNAHNQFLQTYAQAGWIGVLLLLGYIAALTRSAIRCGSWEAQSALVILTAFMLTTTPLESSSLDVWLLIHIAALNFVLKGFTQHSAILRPDVRRIGSSLDHSLAEAPDRPRHHRAIPGW